MTGAAAQRLQPGPEQQSAASTTLLQSEERVEPSWALAIASPASSSPALPDILQSSLDEATRRRDKEHANKVARAIATHRPLLLLLKLQLLLLRLLLHPHPFTHQFKPASACLYPCIICISNTLQVRTLIDAQTALNEVAPRILSTGATTRRKS